MNISVCDEGVSNIAVAVMTALPGVFERKANGVPLAPAGITKVAWAMAHAPEKKETPGPESATVRGVLTLAGTPPADWVWTAATAEQRPTGSVWAAVVNASAAAGAALTSSGWPWLATPLTIARTWCQPLASPGGTTACTWVALKDRTFAYVEDSPSRP